MTEQARLSLPEVEAPARAPRAPKRPRRPRPAASIEAVAPALDPALFVLPERAAPEGRELITDSFAGGGGASTGILLALGRGPDVAINHDAEALALHAANHPETLHLSANIWQVDPVEVVKGRKVGLSWFSPDCKHFSRAKGGKPVSKGVRDLAWIVVHWAKRVRPRVIILENVEEFRTWGPLTAEGKPCQARAGKTFEHWCASLRRLGYKLEWKELRACDYGAPTIRKRFFLIARCDGRPIVWPAPTHGKPESDGVREGRLQPWRTAAEIIDWTLPCPSIFATREEIMQEYGLRAVRPLAEATLRRIALGVKRYVLEDPRPFIMMLRRSQKPWTGIEEPLHTVTAGGAFPSLIVPELAAPFASYAQQGGRSRRADEPLHTLTASAKDQNQLIVPTLIQTGQGERAGQAPRVPGLEKPIGTQVAAGGRHAVVAAFLAQHNGGEIGRPAGAPVSTVTTRGTQQALTAATLVHLRGTGTARHVEAPLPTVTASGQHLAAVSALLLKYYGAAIGSDIAEPSHTDTTKSRFGLVTVEIDGASYAIADIGMRMLTPRERFRAQGFPDDYEIETGRGLHGEPVRLSATAQGRMCGNSVCPPLAEALVRANVPELAVAAAGQGEEAAA